MGDLPEVKGPSRQIEEGETEVATWGVLATSSSCRQVSDRERTIHLHVRINRYTQRSTHRCVIPESDIKVFRFVPLLEHPMQRKLRLIFAPRHC